MGWKIVRDGNEKWCRERGVSGTWRTAADPVRGLARKLIEEASEYGEALDPSELYDLQDVLDELIRLEDPDGRYLEAHQGKIAVHGTFREHVEWTPMPGLSE
jgi:predicted house-cleaning noncanonical NTP pyrophosphatase (MazG superfamily)